MKKWMIRALSALLIAAFLPLSVLADQYDLSEGSVTVSTSKGADGSTQQNVTHKDNTRPDSNPTITSNGQQTDNTITINAGAGTTANVTIKDANISASSGKAAIKTGGEGNVNLNVEGTNTVSSGSNYAGVEKANAGNLTIGSESGSGELTANGGWHGAGIGGGHYRDANDITITGGEVTANGGDGAAGIGGGYYSYGKDITISGGKVVANGSGSAAGIGGGHYGNGSNITISGGEVTATGGDYGAGIGGGYYGNGSNITISGGEVTANGGEHGAGIGGGYGGNGRDITVSGGEVTATGGTNGAGIGGGGHGGNGSDIAITDGKVITTGGANGAGIGGGANGNGSNITVSGGEVNASGSVAGAGIGGGLEGGVSGITISGDAQVTARGGTGDSSVYEGAAIGYGGHQYGSFGPEVPPDTSGLYTTGKVERIPGDGTVLDTITGTVEPPKPTEPEKSASSEEEPDKREPLYRVLNLDGSTLKHQAQKADGVLALTAKADGAILTGTLRALGYLQNQGIEKITFTDGAHSAELVLAELIAKGQPEDVYVLTLGAENTLTLNGEVIDF